jgi:hypothetical protein
MEDNTLVETNFSATMPRLRRSTFRLGALRCPRRNISRVRQVSRDYGSERFCQRKSAVADSAAEDRSGRPAQDRS